MPIQPNFLERTAFFTLNAEPAPMLDLAGALLFHPDYRGKGHTVWRHSWANGRRK
jgi:hypothetical protein